MAVHELKVCSTIFRDIDLGIKTFEFRKNDRNFKVGDTLFLRSWNTETGNYVGRGGRGIDLHSCTRLVTYIINGPNFGIPEGYCIMSII